MSFHSEMAYKLAFTSQALSTMGHDVRWDAAVTAVLRWHSLLEADQAFGRKAAAEDAWHAARFEIQRKYGEAWKAHPQARSEDADRDSQKKLAEDAFDEEFLKPYSAALRSLARTPSPTLAAAVFKQLFCQAEEVWNGIADPVDCMTIITKEFDRLAPASGCAAVPAAGLDGIFAAAVSAYQAAKEAEDAYDSSIWSPACEASDSAAGVPVPHDVEMEMERLQNARHIAEEALFAAPCSEIRHVIRKLTLTQERWGYCGIPDDLIRTILADLAGLSAAAGEGL